MRRTLLLSFPLVLVSAVLASTVLTGTMAFAQIALPPGASPQATQDPGYAALMATCKTPQATPARGGGPWQSRI
jgi:hypothetical protein